MLFCPPLGAAPSARFRFLADEFRPGTGAAWPRHYRQAREPKDIFVFRGPHVLATQSPENMRLVSARMAAFARAAVLSLPNVPGAHAPKDLRDLVTSSADQWERTSDPARGGAAQ